MHGTEQALKAVLRFLYLDMHACLCLPSRDETIMSQVDDAQLRSVRLLSFSDASHAVAICVPRECCVWKIGSPSSFCTS